MCYRGTARYQGRCGTPASTRPKKAVIPVGVSPILRRAHSRSSAAWSAAPSVSLCAGGVQWRCVEQAAGKRASLSPQTEQWMRISEERQSMNQAAGREQPGGGVWRPHGRGLALGTSSSVCFWHRLNGSLPLARWEDSSIIWRRL